MSVVSRDGVGVNDVGVKGVRDAKESPARCRFARWSRRSGCRSRSSSLNGGVSYKACRHETSPCPGVGEIPVEAVVSPVVPVELKRPSAL